MDCSLLVCFWLVLFRVNWINNISFIKMHSFTMNLSLLILAKYWNTMNKFSYFISKRGSNSENLHLEGTFVYVICRIFFLHPILMHFFIESFVLRDSGRLVCHRIPSISYGFHGEFNIKGPTCVKFPNLNFIISSNNFFGKMIHLYVFPLSPWRKLLFMWMRLNGVNWLFIGLQVIFEKISFISDAQHGSKS